MAIVACSAAVAAAEGDANRSTCSPQTVQSPGYRSYLPDCRAYELVSPPYKEGAIFFGEPAAISADGDTVVASVAGVTGGGENDLLDGERTNYIDVLRLARTPQGWQYRSLVPPASRYERSAMFAVADRGSQQSLWGAQAAAEPVRKEDVYLQEPDGELVSVGPGEVPALASSALDVTQQLDLVGASADLSRSLYSIRSQRSAGASDLWPGDSTEEGASSLYEYDYAGAPLGEPTLVGVRNAGPLASNAEAQLLGDCGTELGGPGSEDTYNAVSSGGEAVFFTVRACPGGPPVDELYARLDGSETVDVSEPSAADCTECDLSSGLRDARFAGASSDGEKVFFTTEQELLPGARGMNLYEYDFAAAPGRRVTLVSGGEAAAGGEAAGVQGVVRVAEDGARVYFVAAGVLTSKPDNSLAPGRERPEAGGENLYVRDTLTGSTAFVATLLDAREEADVRAAEEAEAAVVTETAEGSARRALEEALAAGLGLEEAFALYAEVDFRQTELLLGALGPSGTLAEDRSVWQAVDSRPAQATLGEGRYLLFVSSADLTVGDTSAVPQLFRYDAADETLTRVSIGDGPGNGNVSDFDQAPRIPTQSYSTREEPSERDFHLAISADGARVVFTSAAALTPLAVSGAPSVFEYREGAVYLISDGRDASRTGIGEPSVRLYGSDPSGRDVFFTTADPLVPQVGDSQQALYDAREEGGFPAPVLASGCGADTCRGTPAPAPVLPAPAVVAPEAEALAPPAAISVAAAKPPARSPGSARARRLARALRACARVRGRTPRRDCRALAERRYGKRSARDGEARRPRARTGGRMSGKERTR